MTLKSHASTYWSATAQAPGFPQLSGDLSVDIAVIGGGIVGITTARLLKDSGLKVAVLEAHRVGQQVTGKSTAKVSSQHSTIYHTLQSKFGDSQARLYGAAQQLGLPATLVRETDLPYSVLAALRFDGQAQFHPIKYVAGLARTLPGDGSHVFEHSRVLDWEPTRVVTAQGTVSARHVVMATHLPLGHVGLYYAQAFAQAEPVIAAPIAQVPAGMYLNVESPSHSLRTHRAPNGKVYAIAAGNSFKPGDTDDERQAFADLERWLTEHFEAGPIEYRWVNEDYVPMDGAPFIGWSSSPEDGYLVATGFNAWGITNGTMAAAVIADLVAGRESPWAEAFPASRIKPVAGCPKFVQETLETAAHLVGGYLARRPKSLDELAPGDAAILQLDGKRVADTATSRAPCTPSRRRAPTWAASWAGTARTGPGTALCHGSRFDLSGEVLHGPAVQPLERHSP